MDRGCQCVSRIRYSMSLDAVYNGSRNIMKTIQTLGLCWAPCPPLAENAKRATLDGGIPYTLENLANFCDINKPIFWMSPGLVVGSVVKTSATILAVDQIRRLHIS